MDVFIVTAKDFLSSEKFIDSLKPENEIEFLISSETIFQNYLVLSEMLSEPFFFCFIIFTFKDVEIS